MSEDYRTAPAFKLQGSYRDMNKLAEKVVPIMNEKELQTMILSHYESEAQTLTSGAEANLLKFKELTSTINTEEQNRWEVIKETFAKNKIFRNIDENNPMAQVLAQMSAFTTGVEGIKNTLDKIVKDKS